MDVLKMADDFSRESKMEQNRRCYMLLFKVKTHDAQSGSFFFKRGRRGYRG